MHYGSGSLIDNVLHLPDTRAVFQALEAGKVGAAFVDLRTFDAWRDRHGSSGLAPSGYVHSVVFNMGLVGLASDMTLFNRANSILAVLLARDAIAPLAASAGLTYAAENASRGSVRPSALGGD